MSAYVMGIDIGTQGVKGALFNEQGHCISESLEKSKLEHPFPDATTEDPEYQYGSVIRVIKSCLEQAIQSGLKDVSSHIAALSIDGQMAGLLAVGEDGHAVIPYDSWLDSRCSPYVEMMRTRAHDLILQRAGTAPSINHGPKKLWWKHERPDIFKKIVKFTQPGAYAALRLCGKKGSDAFIDRTYLHFSGFANTANGIWDEELCDMFDMPMQKLPNIVESTQMIGTISSEAAGMTGLLQGTPVAAGCGDSVASFLASGAVEEGMSVDVAGTASIFACTQNNFVPDVKSGILGCCASVIPNLWYSYAYINGGGMNPEWFATKFEGSQGDHRFKKLEEETEKIADTLSLPLFIPHMAGRVMPGRPKLRGFFAGLQWEHEKPHLFRAILESVALEYGLYKEAAEKLNSALHIREVRITGGGEKSRNWNTIKSGVLQVPVVRIHQNQGAPLGGAMVAAVASGMYNNFLDVACDWISAGEVVNCDSSRYEYFEKRLKAYKRLLYLCEEFTEEFPFSD